MKKWILFLPMLAFFQWLSAQDIDVPQTNKPLVTKYTASWCPNCGSWGWTLFNNLIADNAGDALLLAAHYSGNYQNAAAVAWYENDDAFYQPVFYVNNENQGALSGNIASVRETVRGKVQQINGQAPAAQTGIRAQVSGDYALEVETKTRFFQNATGEYFLGVYLVEKSFVGYQSGQGNNAQHKQMLRLALSPGAFGALLANGSLSAGAEFEQSYTLSSAEIQAAGITNLDGLLTGNIEIATVIWKKVGGKYEAVNANSSVVSIVSSTAQPEEAARFELRPNVVSRQAAVLLELSQDIPDASLSLYSPHGALLRTLHQGRLRAGLNSFELHRENLPPGLYVLRLATAKAVITRPAVFP